MSRIIDSLDELGEIGDECRKKSLVLGLCHGCFDIVHHGHIHHFMQAKKKVDLLCVSVTADHFVGKGPSRPIFSDRKRAEFISAIRYCDFIVVNNHSTAEPVISKLKPAFFFKGSDYYSERDARLQAEKALVESFGGELVFTDSKLVDSTTRIERLILSKSM